MIKFIEKICPGLSNNGAGGHKAPGFPAAIVLLFCMLMWFNPPRCQAQVCIPKKTLDCTSPDANGAWRCDPLSGSRSFTCQYVDVDPIPDPDPIPIEFPIMLAATVFDSNTGWEVDGEWMFTPDLGNAHYQDITGPMMGYDIAFNDPEPLYVWILGEFTSASSDSVHFGLDGIKADSITFLNKTWSNTLQDGGRAIINATPGQHVFNIWQREDGTKIKEIRITSDPAYTP